MFKQLLLNNEPCNDIRKSISTNKYIHITRYLTILSRNTVSCIQLRKRCIQYTTFYKKIWRLITNLIEHFNHNSHLCLTGFLPGRPSKNLCAAMVFCSIFLPVSLSPDPTSMVYSRGTSGASPMIEVKRNIHSKHMLYYFLLYSNYPKHLWLSLKPNTWMKQYFLSDMQY